MGKFMELAKATVSEGKEVVISIDSDNKYSVAQRILVNNDGKEIGIFLKNSIVTDKAGLEKIKAAVDKALGL